MKKSENKKSRKSKILKAIAFSEMCVMILASFAFAFILSGGLVSGADFKQKFKYNSGCIHIQLPIQNAK